jgi:flavin reductase (DIM6/NTAB) family NADH-FMN oxidoreductase RutF
MQRPWNLPDAPIYSLATHDTAGRLNMNICTYVTAISMKPKMYAIAVFENTKTLENIKNGSSIVLQLLSPDQYNLVNYLGKKSGNNYDKELYLTKKDAIQEWYSYRILKNISAVVSLAWVQSTLHGDHHLMVFSVDKYKSFSPDYLTTDILNDHKIIRI